MPKFPFGINTEGIHSNRATIPREERQNFNSKQRVKFLNRRRIYKTLQLLIHFIKTNNCGGQTISPQRTHLCFEARLTYQKEQAPKEQRSSKYTNCYFINIQDQQFALKNTLNSIKILTQRAFSSNVIFENKANIFIKYDENQKQQIIIKVLKPRRAHNVITSMLVKEE